MAAKTTDPQDEIVRRNMVKFREESDMSQALVGDLSGVPLDAIRRYESGTTATVPGTVLNDLAKLYGRSIDDFFATNPPKARPEDAPVLFLRARPGAEIDTELYEKLKKMIDEANEKMRGALKKKR